MFFRGQSETNELALTFTSAIQAFFTQLYATFRIADSKNDRRAKRFSYLGSRLSVHRFSTESETLCVETLAKFKAALCFTVEKVPLVFVYYTSELANSHTLLG